MADQGKWFKLWESALDDQELENLSIHEWYCWARLGTYLKKHGRDGKLAIKAPAIALQNLLRVNSLSDVISMVQSLPGYVCEDRKAVTANVTVEIVTYEIVCSNWNKYQGDFSNERVRRYRARVTANVTAQEERRRRREVDEKRRDVSPKPPLPSATPTSGNGAATATPKISGLQPTGPIISTLKINGKLAMPEPEIPEDQRMRPEEMEIIRRANMRPDLAKAKAAGTLVDVEVVSGEADDVF